jgi:hypothetical protein
MGRHGEPVAFYLNKHPVFRKNTATSQGDGMTHFDRALEALNIEMICVIRYGPRVGSSGPMQRCSIG